MLVSSKTLWLVVALGFLSFFLIATAQDSVLVEQLRSQISSHNAQIANLEKEIKQYEQSLSVATKQAGTLQDELTIIDTERKKLSTEIKLTESKIAQTNLNLKQLAIDIGDKDQSIREHQSALGESLRKLRSLEGETLVEMVLASQQVSDFFVDQNRFVNLQEGINEQISTLRELKTELADRKTATEAEKKKLVSLNNELGDRKKLADQNRTPKDKLLKETKNSEAAYQQLLADRRAKKEAFERELYDYESQLKNAIDTSLLPKRGSRPLSWPLTKVVITQLFGRTVDSVRLYASGTHNGIDLAASVGTEVKAAGSGVVEGVGDTDQVCPKASFGKWILLKHPNGLSTLYGHLSLIKVSPGQKVSVGQLIAYSGNTGYSTGPHLHFTVYATQGVQITSLKSKVCAGTYVMPVADPKAYLDPLTYLPSL